MKCVDARNMHGRGRYGKFGRKCLKDIFLLEHIYADRRTQTKYTVKKWSRICWLDSSGLGCLSVTGYKTFSLQERPCICSTDCVSVALFSINTDELKSFITMLKYLVLQKTYLINHDGFTPIHSGSRQSVYEHLASSSAGRLILIKHLWFYKEKRHIICTRPVIMLSYQVLILHCVGRVSVLSLRD